jgi:hypothetical protein
MIPRVVVLQDSTGRFSIDLERNLPGLMCSFGIDLALAQLLMAPPSLLRSGGMQRGVSRQNEIVGATNISIAAIPSA